MGIEARLKELGITLPPVPGVASYPSFVPGVLVGETLYLSGTLGRVGNELPYRGKVGAELTVEQASQSARLCALCHLAQAKAVLGDLDRIVRVVSLWGFVNGAPGFKQAPAVLNGASDLFIEVFGPERGRHARASLNTPELIYDAPVETIAVFQVRPAALKRPSARRRAPAPSRSRKPKPGSRGTRRRT